MEDCLFCKISKGEVASTKVYEDDDVFAFLDIEPNTPGHTLVIPKNHSENIFDIKDADLQKVIIVGKKIANLQKEKLGAVGVQVSNNNGSVAHQIIFHFHLHIVPRYENDGLQFYGDHKRKRATTEELELIAQKINS